METLSDIFTILFGLSILVGSAVVSWLTFVYIARAIIRWVKEV